METHKFNKFRVVGRLVVIAALFSVILFFGASTVRATAIGTSHATIDWTKFTITSTRGNMMEVPQTRLSTSDYEVYDANGSSYSYVDSRDEWGTTEASTFGVSTGAWAHSYTELVILESEAWATASLLSYAEVDMTGAYREGEYIYMGDFNMNPTEVTIKVWYDISVSAQRDAVAEWADAEAEVYIMLDSHWPGTEGPMDTITEMLWAGVSGGDLGGPEAGASSGWLEITHTFQAGETVFFEVGTSVDAYAGAGEVVVPEPTTVALLGIGLVGLAGAEVRRRRKKKAVDNS